MKNLSLIALMAVLPFAVGCKKDAGRGSLPSLGSGANVPQLNSNDIVLAMGQSNMRGLPPQTPASSFTQNTGIPTINCSMGGTSITEWSLTGNLDQACMVAVGSKRVIGILWYQGETDALHGMTDWDHRFYLIAQGWRARWGNIPIVIAQLSTADCTEGWCNTWDLIKSQQATTGLQRCAVVKTDDLPRRDDVHITADSYSEVGRRMASSWATLN